MVTIVFRSRLRPEYEAEFRALSERMLELAERQPGFVSYRSYASPDGERVSVIEFESREAARRWGEQADHREAQRLGRERFYSEYSLQVCETVRKSEFRWEP